MESSASLARLAGALYAVNILAGLFCLMYVPTHVIVHGDPGATLSRLVAHESLFRAGIAANVIAHVAFLLLPLALYALLSPVNGRAAVVMVALAVACIPIDFVAIANQLDVLSLLRDAEVNPGMQTQAAVWSLLGAYDSKLLVAEVFWGLWLLPFGYLVFKSSFLPRIVGICLMLGCFSYLIDFFQRLLAPHINLPGYAMLPAALGEMGIALWLLVMGVGKVRS